MSRIFEKKARKAWESEKVKAGPGGRRAKPEDGPEQGYLRGKKKRVPERPDLQESEEQGDGSMSSLDRATDQFIEAVLASEVYRTYRTELEKVQQMPELKQQIDEFRKRNFELQLNADTDFNKLDRFEKEYENFREQPMVADFLAAELDLCRMMQNISMRVTEKLDFS
ncbi:MAG: YlbF family regulator [bacterium]|nr:YlbF family regulator [bacterium]